MFKGKSLSIFMGLRGQKFNVTGRSLEPIDLFRSILGCDFSSLSINELSFSSCFLPFYQFYPSISH